MSAVAQDPRVEMERLLAGGCQCPHGELIQGATLLDGAVRCGVMARDAQRADSILELAPDGVLRMREDPSIVFGFCLGDDMPAMHPDEQRGGERIPHHFTACPIYAADKQIEEVSKRMFGELVTGDDRLPKNADGSPILEEEPVTPDELRWLTDPELRV